MRGTSTTDLRSRGQRGSVTAEAALVIPLLMLVAMALCWVITLVIAQVRLVDAARDAARAAARGEGSSEIREHVSRSAPYDPSVAVRTDEGVATVEVRAAVDAPAWLLVPLPAVDLSAASSVELEDAGES